MLPCINSCQQISHAPNQAMLVAPREVCMPHAESAMSVGCWMQNGRQCPHCLTIPSLQQLVSSGLSARLSSYTNSSYFQPVSKFAVFCSCCVTLLLQVRRCHAVAAAKPENKCAGVAAARHAADSGCTLRHNAAASQAGKTFYAAWSGAVRQSHCGKGWLFDVLGRIWARWCVEARSIIHRCGLQQLQGLRRWQYAAGVAQINILYVRSLYSPAFGACALTPRRLTRQTHGES